MLARPAAAAFLFGTLAVLVVDAVLQMALAAVNLSGGTASPWWATAHLLERGRWVVLAGLVWLVTLAWPTRHLTGDPARGPLEWRWVGLSMLTVPILWTLATWLVNAVLFTLAGRWDIDGRVFLEVSYYRRLVVDYAPWLLGGSAVVAWAKHNR